MAQPRAMSVAAPVKSWKLTRTRIQCTRVNAIEFNNRLNVSHGIRHRRHRIDTNFSTTL